MKLVFNQTATAARAAGAGLAPCRGCAATELERVGRFRFVICGCGFASLEIRLQPLFFFEKITQRILAERGATLDRVTDILAADRFGHPLCHRRIAIRDVKVDETCATADDGFHHPGERAAERFLQGCKGWSGTEIVGCTCCAGRRRTWRAGATFRAGDGPPKQGATTIVSQSFGADDTRQHTAIGKVLLDRAQRLLTGEKHRAHAKRRLFAGDNGWFLEINFQNGVPLVEFRRPRQITKPEKEPSKHTKHDDPNSVGYQMPKVAKIESALWLDELFAYSRQRGIGSVPETPGDRFRERLINHEKVFARGVLHTTR